MQRHHQSFSSSRPFPAHGQALNGTRAARASFFFQFVFHPPRRASTPQSSPHTTIATPLCGTGHSASCCSRWTWALRDSSHWRYVTHVMLYTVKLYGMRGVVIMPRAWVLGFLGFRFEGLRFRHAWCTYHATCMAQLCTW